MKNETLKGFCALLVTVVTLLVFSTNNASAFEVITGSVTEISGPDDLSLDPDKAIIAVDAFGNGDSSVNGVTFSTDRVGLGDSVVEEGKVQVGDVSVTISAPNQIDNWAGANTFTGGTEGSAAALSEIMRDIRWQGAPNPLDISVAGLTAGSTYKVQLLFNEGADRDRGWDIAVNGELAVDNFNSEGGDGTWTNANSFSYNVDATATADGTIAVKMQNNIGGADQVAADGNPILQGVIVSSTASTLQNDIVSYWAMDESYDDEVAGNSGVDLNGGVEFKSGKFGQAAYLDGSQAIEISGDENTYDFAGQSFSLSAWYTAEAIDKGWQCLVAKGEGNGWRFHRRGGDNPPELSFTGGNGDLDRHNNALVIGGDPETWHHVVGVTNSETNESILYLDGVEAARKGNSTLQDRTNRMIIGDNPDARNRGWQGKIDDVTVWSRAITVEEVSELWNDGNGKSISDVLGIAEVLPIVDIDLTGADLGELATITNSGTLDGDFTAEVDTPSVTEVDGVKAITLDGSNDWYVGPTSPLTGDADRTVETWVFNPEIPGEETIVAWGRRGGPDSTNWSMNYGNHNTWGALGGWGGSADMPFVAGVTGGPEAGKWHHLALTYDKASNTRSIYVDGFLSNFENNDPALNTWGVANDEDATPLPIVIGNQNEPNGTRVDDLSGSLSIAKMKIWDQSLSALSVFNSFNSDRATFGLGGPIVASFSSSSSSIIAGGSTTLSWSILEADTISIDNGVGAVTGTETSVSPAETTTYTITATDADGVEKTATTTISVSQPAPSSAVVIHQWKFEEEGGAGTTLVDSVGGKDGSIVDVGANDGTVGGGSVTLAGGGKADSDYVRLPAGLISSLSSASIETWSTQRSAQNWSRVFSVGSSSSNVMHMSFTKGGNINENEWRWNAQSNLTLANFGGQPTNPIDEQVHWVVTVDDIGGADNKTKVTIYKNGTEVSTGDTDNNLSGLNDADFFLGRSQWGDNAANASYEEFRIYNGALSADQVQNNTTAGPDGAPPAGAPTYAQNFDGFADGVTDLGDGSQITGAAARVLGGRLQLTRDGEGLGFSSFSVPAMEGTSEGFTATFDYEIFDSEGNNNPADGFSFNYGNFQVGEQGAAEEGMAGRPGVTENISFEVDTWENGNPEQGVNISGVVNGEDVGQLAHNSGIVLEDGSRKTGSVEISWDPSKGATFLTTGLTTNADFTDVDTGAFVGDDAFNFGFSARVGGANQDVFIDNLIITAGKPTPAPLPAPIVYYDFEAREGVADRVVIDKGPNGLNAEINRREQITIGDDKVGVNTSGAPKGSTPGAGADFQGAFLNVPGVSVEGIVNDVEGQNSYTMTAWIKPSDLNGDKFLFGQSVQGIHNGIRGGGFLHQAHWGADNNAATRLTANEWVHAAWVYDGAADTGTIYLNGVQDASVSKNKPNGSGNLIIGGRNGGGENYRGVVDDVAVWNQVLTARQISAIAGGQSPINLLPLDEDNDGIPDGAEIALTGNTTDLGVSVGSKGVSVNSNRDNTAMDADTVAGVIPSKGWVSTDGEGAGANGSITNGFTLDWSSNGTWNTNNGVENGDNMLMNGYIDAVGGDGAAQLKVSGISSAFADGYNVYVYFGSDGNDRTGKIAREGGKTFSYNTFSQQGGNFPAQYTQTTDEADGNPQANYAIFEGLSGDAQTFNIIRGSNNSGFHGIQIVGATTGDFDGDGLSDLAEFEGVTSPIDADTDDDGLNDGAEIAAGTNPNDTDSDNDGLSDGAEIAAGTDPTKVDSDNDGFNDGAEVAKGSDPASADSVPPFPSPIAYYDFERKSTATIDRSFNDNTASVSGNISFVDGGAPDGYTPGAAAKMDGGHFRVPGIDMNSQIRDSGTGSYTMTAWIKPDSLDGERFIFGQTNQGIHNGIRNNAFLHQAHWGADTNGTTNLNDLIPYRSGTSASNYPGGEAPIKAIDGDGSTKYLNFARTYTGIIVTPAAASVVKSIGLSTANDAVERDPSSVAIYGTNDAIVSADNSLGEDENWTLIDSASVELPDARNNVGTVVNFENETEYASYKIVFPTVKGAGNSMQIAEIQLFNSTNFNVLPYDHMMKFHKLLASDNAVVGIHAVPKIGDPDGWIHAAFVYDGATDTGSIYLNGELDWSGQKNPPNGGGHLIIGGRNNGERNYTGLIDEVAVWTEALAAPEVATLATGGNPIVALGDEDGDGFLDAWEVKYAGNIDTLGGTKDASLLAYLNFDNQAEDQSGNGLNGTLSGPAAFSADAEGFSGAAGDYAINLGAINDKSAVVIDNATLDSALSNNTMAVSFWQNNTQIGNTSSFWIHSPSAGSNERGFQAHVPWGDGVIYFDQSGCCNGNQRLTTAGKIKVNEWQHFVFQRDADGNQQIWVDGVKEAENGGTAEALEAFTKITIGAEGGNLNNSLAGRLDDFAVWNRMLTDAEIATLSGGSATTEILNLAPADSDGDGLTDADEYASQASDPTKADSDGDGLDDAYELAIGTQQLVADTDSDGILDGAEVSAGTDPSDSDSDDDGYSDGDEIKTGANPLDANSTPPNLVAYFNFERSSGSSVNDLSAWGNDATVVRPDQTTIVSGGNGPSPATSADFQGGYLNIPGVSMSNVIGGEGSYTLAAWIKPSDLGGNKFLFGQSSQGIHNGIRNGGFLHQAHWGADTNGATNLNDYDASGNDGWIHATWTYDGPTNTGKMYLDGVEDYSGDKNPPNGSGNLIVGGSNGGGDNFRGLVDEVAVWNIAAPADYIAKLAAGQSPLDDDGDGLPDSWAASFGVTDPDGDADDDGITNANEFLVGTNPTSADTDGDGTNDLSEIALGLDPADAFSLPLPAPIAYYTFEGDSSSVVIDRTFNGNDATIVRPDQTTIVSGGTGLSPAKSADFQGGYLNIPEVSMSDVIGGEGSYTFTAWIKPSDLGGNKFLFGQTSQGIHNGIRNGGFLHQAHWGADTNGKTNLNNYDASANDGWVYAAWVYDGPNNIGKMYLDGVEEYSGDKRAPNGSGNLIVGGSNGGGDNFRGLVDEVAIWNVALQEGNIVSLFDGQAPVVSDDSDGDGLADAWENLYAGNLTDLGAATSVEYGTSVNNALTAANSGISADNTYTHAISGGGAETVNGVDFELLDANTTPTNLAWDVSSIKNQINDNNGGWDVGASGVTDDGLKGLLGSFTFNNDGAVGSNQTFTLSGLTPGQDYNLTLFARKWDNGTQRQQTVDFTTGGESSSLTFSEDHPELAPISAATRDTAYSISEVYKAGADGTASVKFTVADDDTQGAPGSFHMYGLSNHEVSAEADLDGDGLSDAAEFASLASDPTKADSDDDGLSDGEEAAAGTSALIADTDGDGLNDAAEIAASTNPLDSDSDDDGYADGSEIRAGSDPTDSNSVPSSLVAYFDFENEEGNVVADKGTWGNDGTKDDDISYGGGPGTSASNYPGGEAPAKAIDGDGGTKYLNFAKTNTGIIVTPQAVSTVASISLTTANDDVRRDPASFVLYGTNEAIASGDNSLGNGEAWTEIASGDLALSDDRAAEAVVNIDNGAEYASYKLLFPTVKDAATNSMQIAEIQFHSAADAGGDAILSAADAILAVHAAPDVPGFAGAPNGNSPGTAANFTDDKINVPGVDLSSVISGSGSYTFAAWIKPSDLGGDKFIFGQSVQGIHNGIRNNGFLHQAHWGADTNGATNLNDYDASANDGWVHAAFVYDGATDFGQIYLDGKVDWEGGKRAPNGSGNLIIGGRNGGELGYVGLIDEIAIWDVAKSGDDIAFLAGGGSPLIDGAADADGDGLNTVQETAAGTDPNNADTDGDGVSDGDEVAGGSDPTDANSRPGYYAQNFDAFDNGTTELNDGSVITGEAATVQDGRLQLTIDGQGLGFSSFTIPALAGTNKGFTATFDYEIFDSEGTNNPADGFGFNYGKFELGEQGAAEEGMAGRPGVTENLSFEVDTWENGNPEQGVNISGVVNGEDVGELAHNSGIVLEDGSRKTGSMEISWDPSSGATFLTTGLTTNADFTAVSTGAFVGDDAFNFGFSARVGGANQDVFIDNLVIVAGKPVPAPLPAPVVYYDFEAQEGAIVADKGANGLNADINRADQLTIGGSGAPKGSTPGVGADFQGGFLNVPGVSVDGIVNDVEGQNSYTMTAWIKPSDLNGDKFLFGQSVQGIHNGIRGGGFLHQAHWGADNNASTKLTADEWVHAAWVYDGVADTGTIYLNGVQDASVDKNAPNGSGNLIIGGRNGGNENYRGVVDDVAVWNEVLTARQIKAIAGGQSPINAAPADDDEDGIPDGYELALVGNITDLGGDISSKSLGVSFNSDRGNAEATMDADTVAGVVPSKGWVSTDGGADAQGGANGSITNGFTVDWSSNGTWNTNNAASNGDNKLMNGYIDAINAEGAAQVAISGINAEFADGYDLYVYFGSDGNNRTGKVSLVDGATYSYNTASAQGGDFPAQYARTTDEADGNPAANYALYEGLSGDTQTVDLIRGSSNSGFHGIQIVKSSGDYDGDGLSDLAEYDGVTSPIVADGDGDGLNDGAEIAAGTNPNNADTDSDGIADGAEITAGTNPTKADTDDDGYSDGNEIAKGSDPTDANSVPGLPTPIAFYNFEAKSSAALDRSFNDNTATVSGNITFVDEGAPSGSSPNAAASMAGGHFRVPGIDMNSQIRDSGDGSYSMVAWIKPDSTEGERFIFGQTNQGIHNGIRNNAFLHQAHWGADTNGATNLNDYLAADDDGWIHAAFVYDGANDIGRIYLDGQLDWEGAKNAPNGDGHLIIGGRNNGERNYTGLIDDVAIWAETLAAAEIAEIAAGGSPIASLTDSDGDGFVDVWENKYAGNLTDLGAGVYAQTFTGPDGTTDLGDGSSMAGGAASLHENALRLTIDGQALGGSSFAVPAIAGSAEGWTAEFDYTLFDSAGNNNPADGFSLNYGDAPAGTLGAAEEGMAGVDGVTQNISFEVDTWEIGNAGSDPGVNISGVVNGADAGDFAFNRGDVLEDGSTKTGKMNIAWSPSSGATFITTGLTTNADFAEVETGDFAASDDHTFIFSARVGGANQTLTIDNLIIRAGSGDFDNDGLTDLAEYNSGASDPTKSDSDGDGLTDGEEVAAGTQPLIADTDGDGLTDGAEGTAGTDPLDSDSDDDGYSDGVEVAVGSDPTKSSSTPPNLLAYYDFEAPSGASITSVVEEGVGGDEPAVIGNDFNEESLTFSDRTHQHNGAAFNADGNLDANGETIVGLPDYLVGGDYIRFANNARDNNPYTATVTADKATSWYLLVDNRLDGAAGNTGSSNASDPVIEGTLQWITDDGWERVNTGISPNGQADYTGVDEGGDGVGAGQGLNQFYSVYSLTSDSVSVLIGGQGIGGSNMLSLVAKTQSSTTVVADKGTWGNNASVERPDQTVVGIEGGAPNGASPGTAADFQGGYLNVPGVDMSNVISGEGSYTLAAWIKPSDLGGNKFLFGQTSQGIHNGIRNGGFLHQAHWGADTNGATNLNDYDASANDGWVHAAWTYDGATNTGKIYLDGVEDYSGDKNQPNGSGNLIVGGSNGGGDNFRGLVDEVAVWDIAASADVIAALAAGTSPLDISTTPSTIDVTSFSYNVGTGDLGIGWTSESGKSYGLEYSLDLKTWVDLEVTVEADAEAATYNLPGAQNPLVGQSDVFLRVYEK